MIYFTRILASIPFGLMLMLTSANAQNLLTNGDFEAFNAPLFGDNLAVNVSPWILGQERKKGGKFHSELLVVKVDGSATQQFNLAPKFWEEDNLSGYTDKLARFDATSNGEKKLGHYLRNNSNGGLYRYITLTQWIEAPKNGCVAFGASFITTSPSSNRFWPTLIELNMDSVAKSPAKRSKALTSRIAEAGTPRKVATYEQPNMENWTKLTGYMMLETGKTYSLLLDYFTATISIDDAFVEYVATEKCS